MRRSWSIPPSRLRRATVPQFNMVASLRAQSALAMFPVSLGLLRPVSATGGGLRTPLFPSGKRRLLAGQLLTIVPLTKRLPWVKGAHEARALCAEQREVSPVRQGASQASPASEEKRLCRTVECCRRQPTESRVRSSWDCPSGHCLSIVQLWQCVVPRRDWLPRSWDSYIVIGAVKELLLFFHSPPQFGLV